MGAYAACPRAVLGTDVWGCGREGRLIVFGPNALWHRLAGRVSEESGKGREQQGRMGGGGSSIKESGFFFPHNTLEVMYAGKKQ